MQERGHFGICYVSYNQFHSGAPIRIKIPHSGRECSDWPAMYVENTNLRVRRPWKHGAIRGASKARRSGAGAMFDDR